MDKFQDPEVVAEDEPLMGSVTQYWGSGRPVSLAATGRGRFSEAQAWAAEP